MELEENLDRANAELKERNRQIESLSQQVCPRCFAIAVAVAVAARTVFLQLLIRELSCVVVVDQAGESIHELSSLSASISSLKAENARLSAALATESEAHKETQKELRKLKR